MGLIRTGNGVELEGRIKEIGPDGQPGLHIGNFDLFSIIRQRVWELAGKNEPRVRVTMVLLDHEYGDPDSRAAARLEQAMPEERPGDG